MFIEPGEVYLSDKLLGSKIFNGGETAGNAGGAPGMGGIEDDDPVISLKISFFINKQMELIKTSYYFNLIISK